MSSSEEVAASPDAEGIKTDKWRLATKLAAQAQSDSWIVESELHAVERVPSTGRGKAAQFIPIRFIFTNKLSKDDKLLLAFDAFVLSKSLGHEVKNSRLIHGDESTTLNVNNSALAGEIRKRIEIIAGLVSCPAPPDLVLNRHCAQCEFQTCCRQKAQETDDLSLLTGMSEKERNKLRSKGIFTVTQLSYTFRPRRMRKRLKNPAKPHHLALQALAIRENTVYIHGTPELPACESQVYLDIEGIPDRDNHYLIGALVVTKENTTFHSFWADSDSDETTIFLELANVLSSLPDVRVFHFGEYDAAAMKRVATVLPEASRLLFNTILERAVNVLSLVYSHVYFPTYSNGLKEIEKHLPCDWPVPRATGLESLIWRYEWEKSGEQSWKDRIHQYNRADCFALKHLSEFIIQHTKRLEGGEPDPGHKIKISYTKEMIQDRPHWRMFGPKQYAMVELQQINKCAYFDYQREKVLARTHKYFKAINRRHRKLKSTNLRANEINVIELERCAKCGSHKIKKIRDLDYFVVDLKVSRTGIKKWVRDCRSYRYRCLKCGSLFSSEDRLPRPQKYGHSLASWALYLNIGCGLSMSRVAKSLGDVFQIHLDNQALFKVRRYVVRYYEPLYAELLSSILNGTVLHIDETTVRLINGQNGYVWVLASSDMVYYLYRPSREGTFLNEMLSPFSGVLVSDFYTAYDSLACEQQKCLAHLVRDIDEDLLKNPWDIEFKTMATEFGSLLMRIVRTVDSFGLKKRHLHKHKKEVSRFLKSMASRKLNADLALRYQKRFQKSGSKMFSFLDYDGVPWNNNHAEHAIKLFAKHRRNANGNFTENSLREYLIIASILETCEFNNVSVLDFLLSKETTLSGLFRMAGRRANVSSNISLKPDTMQASSGDA